MAEYIDRLAISKAYMDLCLAMGKQAKSRKGATFLDCSCYRPKDGDGNG